MSRPTCDPSLAMEIDLTSPGAGGHLHRLRGHYMQQTPVWKSEQRLFTTTVMRLLITVLRGVFAASDALGTRSNAGLWKRGSSADEQQFPFLSTGDSFGLLSNA